MAIQLNIPTDKVYKFMTVVGILLILGGFYFAYLYVGLKTKIQSGDSEVTRLRSDIYYEERVEAMSAITFFSGMSAVKVDLKKLNSMTLEELLKLRDQIALPEQQKLMDGKYTRKNEIAFCAFSAESNEYFSGLVANQKALELASANLEGTRREYLFFQILSNGFLIIGFIILTFNLFSWYKNEHDAK